MLTSTQIAEKLGLNPGIVRYRLTELRRTNQIEAEQIGATYGYSSEVLDKVKDFDGDE